MTAVALDLHTRRKRQMRPTARLFVVNDVRQNATAPSPEELVHLLAAVAQDKDREAFAGLFGYFAPRVKSFLMSSGMSGPLAEEVTQEVMIAVWRKAAYFDPERAGVSTWVFSIARNQRIDRFRRDRSPTAEQLLDPSEEPPPPRTAEEIAMSAERESKVRQALAALPREQATIVQLSFFRDKPHAEIALELGIPLGTVKSRIRLALKRLQSLVSEDT
jgi:RNA polymerase sigma-70 factor (ECF subfamily)